MGDHLPGTGRMARSLAGYAVNNICQAHLSYNFFQAVST
jgi:hypothetical protein